MVTFLTFPKFGASMVNLSSVPFSKLFLLLSRCLSPDQTKEISAVSSFEHFELFEKHLNARLHYLCLQTLQRY